MDLSQQSDEALMLAVTNKRESALSELYDRHAATVLGVVYRIVGDRAVAEEVLQEAFWRIWNNADKFDSTQGKFTTWMFSIARRHAIDVYRKQQVRPQLADSANQDDQLAQVADEMNVSQTASSNIEADQIRNAVAALPTDQRQVLEMAYFQGKTRREIAKETNIPLGTIHTRARLGLQRLQKLLVEQGVSYER